MSEPLYISVDDVRAVGIGNPPDDAAITAAIRLAGAIVNKACRQWFYSKSCIFRLDGTDSDALYLPIPIITIDELKINRSDTALDSAYYAVYNGDLERENPRIKLVENSADMDIFTAPMNAGRFKFRRGRQNQYLSGNFGYVESDGSTPLLIKRAVLIIAIEKLTKPLYVAPDAAPIVPPPPVVGPIIEEGTDGHYVKYAQAGGALKPTRKTSFDGLTESTEARQILRMYRAPIGISAPADPSYP